MKKWTTFSIVGDVDDGKSTLTGRLVLGSQNFYQDQMPLDNNLAQFSDGLREERRQGITIDIAYRFINLNNRRYRLIDCPGHDQFFAKTLTGLSLVDMVILVVDVNRSLTEQNKKLLRAIKTLAIDKLVVAINKIDSVEKAPSIYGKVQEEVSLYLNNLAIKNCEIIPISALADLNITNTNISWFKGPSLLQLLEMDVKRYEQFAFQVQRVVGPWVYGEVIAGNLVKDHKIETIIQNFNEVSTVRAPASVTLRLTKNNSCQRGDIWSDYPLLASHNLKVSMFNFKEVNFLQEYILLLNYREYPVKIKESPITQGFMETELISAEVMTASRYNDFKPFGRFLLLSADKICVAAGIINS